jgi:hypothetical protein
VYKRSTGIVQIVDSIVHRLHNFRIPSVQLLYYPNWAGWGWGWGRDDEAKDVEFIKNDKLTGRDGKLYPSHKPRQAQDDEAPLCALVGAGVTLFPIGGRWAKVGRLWGGGAP